LLLRAHCLTLLCRQQRLKACWEDPRASQLTAAGVPGQHLQENLRLLPRMSAQQVQRRPLQQPLRQHCWLTQPRLLRRLL
jgi:hypothetical protein